MDSDVFDALYVLEKGEMVMQTALYINDHHVRGVLVDENDQKSAVSVGYLEEGLLKVRDKVNNELFESFIDFRKPDFFDTVKSGNIEILRVKKSFVNFSLSHKDFTLNEYLGREGTSIRALRVTSNPFRPIHTQFVYIGLSSNPPGKAI